MELLQMVKETQIIENIMILRQIWSIIAVLLKK